MKYSLRDLDVVVLCGGPGTRLQGVIGETPKILAPLGNKVLLDILFEEFKKAGFRNIILCVGFQKEKIKNYIKEKYFGKEWLQVLFSDEEKPLGTGGALKNSFQLVSSDHVLVMNGDTIFKGHFQGLYDFHRKNDSLLTLGVQETIQKDYGTVGLNAAARIIAFKEKMWGNGDRYASIGMYCMKRDIEKHMPAGEVFSLEHDVFPALVGSFPCFGYRTKGIAHDIGTKERYEAGLEIASKECGN